MVLGICREGQGSFGRSPQVTRRFRAPAAGDRAVSAACRRPSPFSLLAHATAEAVANDEAGPKGGGQDARSQEKEPREMAWFNPLGIQARCVEGGTIPTYAIDDAATPRRIWKLREAKPRGASRRFGLARLSLSLRSGRCGGFCALGARCCSGPLGGGEARTMRPRSGRGHGWTRLFARAGARSKSPAPPHALAGQDARRAPPRGVVSSWLLLLWTSKGEVTRPPAGGRNRVVPSGRRTKPP